MHSKRQIKYVIAATGLAVSFTVFAQTPQLDELNKLKAENALKDMQIAQMQKSIVEKNLADANDKMQQLVISVEKQYPGFTIDLRSITLVEKPKPPEAQKTPVQPMKK